MKAVIVEDEYPAAQNLKRLIQSVDDSIEVITVLQTVEDSVAWFSTNSMPDVVFMDIHLADGDSFSIFKDIDIQCPIIFTTAYDKYALKAFEVNSIDYLLKPISERELAKALKKLGNLSSRHNYTNLISEVVKNMRQSAKVHRKSFLFPYKDKLIPVSTDAIAYIYSKNKKAVVTCFNREEYTIDSSLDEFLKQLDPEQFFRANRQYIVSHSAVTDLTIWFDGKIAVNLSVDVPERIIVSRARSTEFKNWFTRAE